MVMAGVLLRQIPSGWAAGFTAMASPCEVLIDGGDRATAARLAEAVANEAWRIERKFSRYRDDNIVHRINTANGVAVTVDAETAQLLDFADTCFQLSEGLFDITSGVLREVWRFDGSDRLPSPAAVEKVLARVGWQRVSWRKPQLRLEAGMEIDFGGIGKEYAVDRCAALLRAHTDLPFLLNFGGDLCVSGPRADGEPWRVGIENPEMQQMASAAIELQQGAIATSGDSRRFLLKNGKRYSHILDPRSGWPVEGAPRSVTVAAATTTEAGMLATFASLHGQGAADFLQQQQVQHWILW